MRAITTIALIAVICGLTAAHMQYGLASAKLASADLRLRSLSEGLHNLRQKVDEAHDDDSVEAFEELHKRLALLQGNHCHKGAIKCGESSEQCVSDLAFCDGHSDCNNEFDEGVCKDVPKSGTFWAGKVYRAGCGFTEQSRARLFITGNNYNPFFGPRVGITATFKLAFEDAEGLTQNKNFNLVGNYDFGRRELDLDDHGHIVELKCDFNMSNKWMHCNILESAAQLNCGHIHLVLQP